MNIGSLMGKSGKKKAQDAAEKAKELPRLEPDMRLEIMTSENRLIFLGRIEWVKANAIQVCDILGEDLPYIEYNTPIKLRGFSDNCAFYLEGIVGGNTRLFWRIDHLATLQAGERRGYFRQNVVLDAVAMRISSPFEKGTVAGSPQGPLVGCTIINISATGAMMVIKEPFQEGEWVSLSNVRLQPKEPPFTFTCAIRRKIIQEDGSIAYGCEFYDLHSEEQERLIKIILLLQRKELNARRSSSDDL